MKTPTAPIPRESDPQKAASLLDAGELVLLPTETVYGLAASAASITGLERFSAARDALAGRPMGSAASAWHAPAVDAVLRVLEVRHPLHKRLIHKLAPGPVTFAIDMSEEEVAAAAARLGVEGHAPFADERGVLVRVPSHPVALAVLAAARSPVIAEGVPVKAAGKPAAELNEAAGALARAGVKYGAALDGGPGLLGKPSSLLRLTGAGGWELVHAGPFDQAYIARRAERNILFVCTGNTCRSPMAEAIAKGLLAQGAGSAATMVRSAGVGALDGAGFSPEVVTALERLGMAPPRGAARMLTAAMVTQADEVYVMTRSHRGAVLGLDPSAGSKVQLLDPSGRDVPDPIGAGQERYDQVAAQMEAMIRRRLQEPGA